MSHKRAKSAANKTTSEWKSPPGGWRDKDATDHLILRALVHADGNQDV